MSLFSVTLKRLTHAMRLTKSFESFTSGPNFLLLNSVMSLLQIINIERERRVRRYNTIPRHIIYNDETDFYARYKITKNTFNYVLNFTKEDLLRHRTSRTVVTPEMQLLMALRFFSSGSFFNVIGDTFGVHKSTVSRAITMVSDSICAKLDIFVKFLKWQDFLES